MVVEEPADVGAEDDRAPCARLTTFITPHQGEADRDEREGLPPEQAMTIAWSRPVTRSSWPDEVGLGHVLRPHRDDLAGLDLDDDHRLAEILAGGVELDRAEEGLCVEARQRGPLCGKGVGCVGALNGRFVMRPVCRWRTAVMQVTRLFAVGTDAHRGCLPTCAGRIARCG